MTEMERLALDVEQGQSGKLEEDIRRLMAAGAGVDEIVRDGIMAGLHEVGRKFEIREYFLPEMLNAARAAKRAEQMLMEAYGRIPRKYHQKVLLGTVKNDLHDIGKNMVRMAMENIGLEVIDLGVDVGAGQFVQAAEADEEIAFVGVSALLTTTMPAMRDTVRALKSSSAAGRITILVGGAPVTKKFADKIGADIYTKTAFEAAEAVRAILEGGQKT